MGRLRPFGVYFLQKKRERNLFPGLVSRSFGADKWIISFQFISLEFRNICRPCTELLLIAIGESSGVLFSRGAFVFINNRMGVIKSA